MSSNKSIPEFNKGFLIVIGLLLVAMVVSAPGCFEPEERGAEELVCDSEGCQLCEGTLCRPYYCSSDSQCPHPYSCTSQGLCSLQPGPAQQTTPKQPPAKDDPSEVPPVEYPVCLGPPECCAVLACVDGACMLV